MDEIKKEGDFESFQFIKPEEKTEIKKLPQPINAATQQRAPEDPTKVPQKKNIFLMVVLSIITLGIYSSVWYLKRSPEFYNLGTRKKLGTGLPMVLLIFNIIFIALIVILPLTITTSVGDFFQNLTTLQISLIFTLGIIFALMIFFYILLEFFSRTIVNQALENKGSRKKISVLLTLVFGYLYLQYEINRINEDKEEAPKFAPWAFLIIIILLIAAAVLNSYIKL